MKIFITALCLCFITCSPALKNENEPTMHGTLFIGAIASDGLVMAIDSRIVINDFSTGAQKEVAYADALCKIFPFANYQMAVAGNPQLAGQMINTVLDDFNASANNTGLTNSIFQFEAYLHRNYELQWQEKTVFFACGYEGSPNIWRLEKKGITRVTKDFIASDSRAEAYLSSYINKKFTAMEIAPVLEKAILTYAQDYKLTGSVGGPTTILRICPDNTLDYIKNDLRENIFITPRDLAQAMLNDSLPLYPLVPGGKEAAFRFLQSFR